MISSDASRIFEADPRIELIAAVEALSRGNPCSAGEASGYHAEVLRSFDPGHPACRMFAAMSASDWRHRHPSLILFDFSAPPELEIAAHHDHYRNQGREDALSRFIPLLRDFASSGGFMDFFAAHRSFYDSLSEPTRRRFAKKDYRAAVDEYLGVSRPHRYHFVMAPLYHGASHHNVLYARKDGVFDIYSVNGHRRVAGGVPDFELDADELAFTAWHEIAHTVVDAVTQEYRAELLPLAPLYGLMTGLAKSKYQGPAGWLHMVDEHVIRAVTARLAALHRGAAAGAAALEKEKRDGFALIGPVHETLREYEEDRSRYPTIRHFYPRLVETLARLHSGVRAKAGWKAGRPGAGGAA